MPNLGWGGIQSFHLFGLLDNMKYIVGEGIVDAKAKMHRHYYLWMLWIWNTNGLQTPKWLNSKIEENEAIMVLNSNYIWDCLWFIPLDVVHWATLCTFTKSPWITKQLRYENPHYTFQIPRYRSSTRNRLDHTHYASVTSVFIIQLFSAVFECTQFGSGWVSNFSRKATPWMEKSSFSWR